MVFFSLDGVLRGFPAAAYVQYASPQIPPRRDAALSSEKNSHLWIRHSAVPSDIRGWALT
jgi:hypothetical protein